jgi:hypothetical protein
MQFYYLAPHPECFIDEVRQMSAMGALARLEQSFASATFLSRVMAANPDHIRGWLEALSDLTPEDFVTLKLAAWLSCTPEANAGWPRLLATWVYGKHSDTLGFTDCSLTVNPIDWHSDGSVLQIPPCRTPSPFNRPLNEACMGRI